MKPSRPSYPASAKDSDRGTSEFLPKTQSSVNFLTSHLLTLYLSLFTHNDLQKEGLPQLHLSEVPWNFLTLETAAVLIRVSSITGLRGYWKALPTPHHHRHITTGCSTCMTCGYFPYSLHLCQPSQALTCVECSNA